MKTFIDFINALTGYYSTKTLVMIKEYDLTSQPQSEAIEEYKFETPNNSVVFHIHMPVVEEEDKEKIQQQINELHKYPFDIKSAQRLAKLQQVLDNIEENNNS